MLSQIRNLFGPAVRVVYVPGENAWYVEVRYGFLGGWYRDPWNLNAIHSFKQAQVRAEESAKRMENDERAKRYRSEVWRSGRIRW
jgi:hypothetical protein